MTLVCDSQWLSFLEVKLSDVYVHRKDGPTGQSTIQVHQIRCHL